MLNKSYYKSDVYQHKNYHRFENVFKECIVLEMLSDLLFTQNFYSENIEGFAFKACMHQLFRSVYFCKDVIRSH